MFYYLYQITNTLNGKIYVGVHKTKSLDDGYMGSGKYIRNAIQKHGISNFTKVILEHFEDQTAMYAKEGEIVNFDFILREDTYNIRLGGKGGFEVANLSPVNGIIYESIAERNKAISPFGTSYGNEICKLGGLAAAEARKDPVREIELQRKTKETKIANNTFYPTTWNQLHTVEAQKKKKEIYAKINHQQGEKNSQFGKRFIWITNDVLNIKFNGTINQIPEGYRRGKHHKK